MQTDRTVQLATFIGKGGVFNRAIRRRTKGQESHSELIIDGLWHSSDIRDGGVRRKYEDPQPGEWEIITLPWADPDHAIAVFNRKEEKRYGLWDIIFHLFGIRRNGPGEICSEICAEALDFEEPWTYNPKTLRARCLEKNLEWEQRHGTRG